jgi:T5SS/PEP-CTERM-associated repeat protein
MRRKTWFVWGLLIGAAFSFQPANAQYTSDYQTNVISGVTSNWSGTYIVGSSNIADVLWIDTNGTLSDDGSYVGYKLSGSNNIVVLTGTQSVWRTSGTTGKRYVGYAGTANQLIITNLSYGYYIGAIYGGVYSSAGYVGYMPSSSNNIVLIAGTGSFWAMRGTGVNDSGNFYVGYAGAANQLIISNVSQGYQRMFNLYDGAVYDNIGKVGYMESSSNNTVLVSGTNSAWDNSSDLTVGYDGRGNQLVITNGGSVLNRFGYLGFNSSGRSNVVVVSGSGST